MNEAGRPPAREDERSSEPAGSGSPSEFESLARGQVGRDRSAFVQLIQYVTESNRWWLLPVIIALLLTGLLIVLGSTSAAPFIYTLF
jgi:hypothetical protein